jgi:hypothetical protein
VIDLDTWRLRWTFDGGLAEGEEEREREKTKIQREIQELLTLIALD